MTTPSHDTPMTPSDTPITDRIEESFGEMPGKMRAMERELADLRAKLAVAEKERDALKGEWSKDKPITEDAEIFAAHPMESGDFEIHSEAIRMVSAKYSKWGLVNLVNMLLHRVAKREADLSAAQFRLRVMRDALDETIESGKRLLVEGLLHETVARRRISLRVSMAKGVAALANTSATDLQSAIDGAAKTLNICRVMVEHEMMSCEMQSKSGNAWPDLLDGRVSGGGIVDALAQLAPFVSK